MQKLKFRILSPGCFPEKIEFNPPVVPTNLTQPLLPGYEEFQDKVKQILSKSPTGTNEKLDEQLAVLQILCQHKAGTATSAEVTEAAKNSMVFDKFMGCLHEN